VYKNLNKNKYENNRYTIEYTIRIEGTLHRHQ
jgi:hypothetical protein